MRTKFLKSFYQQIFKHLIIFFKKISHSFKYLYLSLKRGSSMLDTILKCFVLLSFFFRVTILSFTEQLKRRSRRDLTIPLSNALYLPLFIESTGFAIGQGSSSPSSVFLVLFLAFSEFFFGNVAYL